MKRLEANNVLRAAVTLAFSTMLVFAVAGSAWAYSAASSPNTSPTGLAGHYLILAQASQGEEQQEQKAIEEIQKGIQEEKAGLREEERGAKQLEEIYNNEKTAPAHGN